MGDHTGNSGAVIFFCFYSYFCCAAGLVLVWCWSGAGLLLWCYCGAIVFLWSTVHSVLASCCCNKSFNERGGMQDRVQNNVQSRVRSKVTSKVASKVADNMATCMERWQVWCITRILAKSAITCLPKCDNMPVKMPGVTVWRLKCTLTCTIKHTLKRTLGYKLTW